MQNPCFVSSLRVFPLRLSLQCAGFDSAHALRNMRMFFFAPISIVLLTIGLLCHSYTFYVPIPHTGGLSIHLLLCRTRFTRALHGQLFYVWSFSKTLLHTLLRFKFKPWFTQTPCFVSKRIFLLNKTLIHRRKKTCFKCFNSLGLAKSFAALKTTPYKHHVLHKSHVLAGPLQGLFACCRITLSVVAGGTRRRRLNIQPVILMRLGLGFIL